MGECFPIDTVGDAAHIRSLGVLRQHAGPRFMRCSGRSAGEAAEALRRLGFRIVASGEATPILDRGLPRDVNLGLPSNWRGLSGLALPPMSGITGEHAAKA